MMSLAFPFKASCRILLVGGQVVMLCVLLSGCRSKDLDRATAMSLLQGKAVMTAQFSFDANPGYPLYGSYDQAVAAFNQLIQGGAIWCNITPSGYGPDYNCALGLNSQGLTLAGKRLTVLAGSLIPTAVTGITQLDPNTASAQVSVSFQATPVYARYQTAFDQLAGIGPVTFIQNTNPPNLQTLAEIRQRGSAQAIFQRYDSGWRLQTIDGAQPLQPLPMPDAASEQSAAQRAKTATAQDIVGTWVDQNDSSTQIFLADGSTPGTPPCHYSLSSANLVLRCQTGDVTLEVLSFDGSVMRFRPIKRVDSNGTDRTEPGDGKYIRVVVRR
jgi:hypothetical protein